MKRLPLEASYKSKIVWILSGDLKQLRKVVQDFEFELQIFTPNRTHVNSSVVHDLISAPKLPNA